MDAHHWELRHKCRDSFNMHFIKIGIDDFKWLRRVFIVNDTFN
jgi:hypothetical protein